VTVDMTQIDWTGQANIWNRQEAFLKTQNIAIERGWRLLEAQALLFEAMTKGDEAFNAKVAEFMKKGAA
jgi:hypothetical protein